jgi:hypothetical protein
LELFLDRLVFSVRKYYCLDDEVGLILGKIVLRLAGLKNVVEGFVE